MILTNFWTGWHENNASDLYGSDAPNQVIANEFCLVDTYGQRIVPSSRGDAVRPEVLLYQRCAKGDGISPAEVGETLHPADVATP